MKPHRTIVRPQPWTNVSIAGRLYMTVRAGPARVRMGCPIRAAGLGPPRSAALCAGPAGLRPRGHASRRRRLPGAAQGMAIAAGPSDRAGAPASPRGHATRRRRCPGAMHCHPGLAGWRLEHRDRPVRPMAACRLTSGTPAARTCRYTTRTRVMSNLISPIALEAVTAGGTVTPAASTGTDSLLQTLTSLQTTIQNIGNTANKTGFSTTDVLLLGLLLSQQRQTVFVHRPFWW